MLQNYYFTFGYGHLLAGHYIMLRGTYEKTRAAIIEQFGTKWSMQYTREEWYDKNDISQEERWGYKQIIPQKQIYD